MSVLERSQWLDVPPERAFAFFADARNLEAITPPWLRFRVVTPRPDHDAPRHADRLPAAPARAAAALADADRRVGAAAPVRRRPAARAVRAVGAHAHVRAGRRRRRRDVRSRALRAAARALGGSRLPFVRRDLDRIFDYRARAIAAGRGTRAGRHDRAALAHARPARARPSGAARGARPRGARRAGVLLRRPAAARPPRLRPAHAVPARVPRDLDGALRRRQARRPPRPARARAAGARARGGRARACTSAPTSGPFARARGSSASRAALARRRARARTPGCTRSTTSARCAPRRGKPYTVFSPVPPHVARRSRGAPVLGRPRAFGRCRRGCARAGCRRSASLGLEQEVRGAAAGRRDARRASGCARFLRARRRDYADDHDALGARPHLAALALPALRLPVAARDRGAAAARRGRGGVPPPALLARLLPPRAAPLPAQRALGVPGALPRRCAGAAPTRRFEAWCEGRTGFPLVDAGDAPAAARGLDAQPRAARRRLVPHQGPRASTGAGASAGSCGC